MYLMWKMTRSAVNVHIMNIVSDEDDDILEFLDE